MPTGVYVRSRKTLAMCRRTIKLAVEASRHSPKAKRQRELAHQSSREIAWSLPRTKKQLRTSSKNLKLARLNASYPRTRKQLRASRRNIQLALKISIKMKMRTPYSKIEKKFGKLLKKSIPGLRLGNFNICCASGNVYHPDIANLKTRRVIEVDGAHWHDFKSDCERDAKLAELGWETLRLPALRLFLFNPVVVKMALDFLRGWCF